MCQPRVRADLSSFCSYFEKAAGRKQSPLYQMNNPIDLVSLPLMKLGFAFAVSQREQKGVLPYFVSILWKHSWHALVLAFWDWPCLRKHESKALNPLSQLTQGCSLYNATFKLKDETISCISIRHSKCFAKSHCWQWCCFQLSHRNGATLLLKSLWGSSGDWRDYDNVVPVNSWNFEMFFIQHCIYLFLLFFWRGKFFW